MKPTPRFRVVSVIDQGRYRTSGIAVGERQYLIPPRGTPPLSRRMAQQIARDLNIGPLIQIKPRKRVS